MPARDKAILLTLLALSVAPASGAAVERTLLLSARPAVVEMRTAALIMSGQQGGDLPIAVAAVPDGKACGGGAGDAGVAPTCRFTALIEIDGAALLEGSPGGGPAGNVAGGSPTEDVADSLPIEIFAYALGTELDVLEQQSLVIDAGQPSHRRLLANTGLKVFLRLEVAPGDHLLRVLVHAGETFGLRSLSLHAGAPAEDAPGEAGLRISTPVFHELAGPWLLAAPAGAEIPLPPPFGLETTSPLPAARPQMPEGGTLAGHIFVTGAAVTGAGGDQAAGDLTAIVRQPAGEPVEAPLTVLDRIQAAGLESVAISFSAPPSIGPGLWEIAVAGGDQTSGDARVRSDFVPIFIEYPSPAVATTGLEHSAKGRTDRRPKPLAGTQRKLARAASEGYVRALRQLADGDSRAALETLMATEEPVVLALDADAVDVLSQSEARVLAALPDADWGCLLPVVLLHLDVSRLYRESGRRILAHHATRMTINLAAAYAAKLDGARATAEAARALASLGGYYQHGGSLSQAEKLFTQALELAPDETALLGLATIHEKRGLFDRALPVFERLVAERPEYAEGLLRLALNQARTGDPAAARKSLRRLAARRENDWVTLLAHQELARLLIDDDRQPEAAEVLRRGLGRWPDHPTLELQLAWVLDTQGEPDPSLALLEDLGASSARPAAERSRYNRWPGDLLADSRRALAEAARSRHDDLGRWLSSQDPADG